MPRPSVGGVYRGHDAPKPYRVYRSGQKRGVHGVIKKELRRRSAVEAVIGQFKTDGHMDRNYLKGRDRDHANAVLTATGHNLRLVVKWLRTLLRNPSGDPNHHLRQRSLQSGFLTDGLSHHRRLRPSTAGALLERLCLESDFA